MPTLEPSAGKGNEFQLGRVSLTCNIQVKWWKRKVCHSMNPKFMACNFTRRGKCFTAFQVSPPWKLENSATTLTWHHLTDLSASFVELIAMFVCMPNVGAILNGDRVAHRTNQAMVFKIHLRLVPVVQISSCNLQSSLVFTSSIHGTLVGLCGPLKLSAHTLQLHPIGLQHNAQPIRSVRRRSNCSLKFINFHGECSGACTRNRALSARSNIPTKTKRNHTNHEYPKLIHIDIQGYLEPTQISFVSFDHKALSCRNWRRSQVQPENAQALQSTSHGQRACYGCSRNHVDIHEHSRGVHKIGIAPIWWLMLHFPLFLFIQNAPFRRSHLLLHISALWRTFKLQLSLSNCLFLRGHIVRVIEELQATMPQLVGQVLAHAGFRQAISQLSVAGNPTKRPSKWLDLLFHDPNFQTGSAVGDIGNQSFAVIGVKHRFRVRDQHGFQNRRHLQELSQWDQRMEKVLVIPAGKLRGIRSNASCLSFSWEWTPSYSWKFWTLPIQDVVHILLGLQNVPRRQKNQVSTLTRTIRSAAERRIECSDHPKVRDRTQWWVWKPYICILLGKFQQSVGIHHGLCTASWNTSWGHRCACLQVRRGLNRRPL